MASSLLNHIRNKSEAVGLGGLESGLEDRISRLNAEVEDLSRLLAKKTAHQGKNIKAQAQSSYDDLLGISDELLKEMGEQYQRGAKELKATVRRHPIATIGAAAAVGMLLTLFARR